MGHGTGKWANPHIATQYSQPNDRVVVKATGTTDVALARQSLGLDLEGNQSPPMMQGRLAQFLRCYSEPIAVRVSKARRHCILGGSLSHCVGPVLVKRWAEDGKELFSTPSRLAYGWACTFRLQYISHRAMTLKILPHRENNSPQTWSMKWCLSFPNIVPRDAAIMELAMRGDINGVRGMFQTGKAACTDTMPDGTNLLHVY